MNVEEKREAEIRRRQNFRESYPDVLKVLLMDRTKSTSKRIENIIWANNHYMKFGGRAYAAQSTIEMPLIVGDMNHVVIPRIFKAKSMQSVRTRESAEVFTPFWMIKEQVDQVDQLYIGDSLEDYVRRTWLEVTCGEAPYITTRYDAVTGFSLPLEERVGFLDRKLSRIQRESINRDQWGYLVKLAFQSTYGFEWNGDSLLLARENLIHTYRDHYMHRWNQEPSCNEMLEIAEILSYNIFQMDGLTYTIPLSSTIEEKSVQLSFFEDFEVIDPIQSPGIPVKIMDWEKGNFVNFKEGIE